MIQLTYIIALVFSTVIGFYGIVLLHQLRNRYKHEFLNSFFYYQILSILFGLYGIIGNLILREFLPKFDVKIAGIEVISHFFSLVGLPFIIAGWFMLLKTTAEICHKKTSQLIAILYFFLTTSAILFYGFYILKISGANDLLLQTIRKNAFLGFVFVEILVIGYIVFFLIINAVKKHNKENSRYLYRFAAILAVITIFKSISLYFSNIHFSIGIYFLIMYFTGTIPLIFLTIKNIKEKEALVINSNHKEQNLFDEFKITPREKEIILEICKGKTNQQIADSLFITLQTVKDHTHNIYQKTGVKNRVQLSQKFT